MFVISRLYPGLGTSSKTQKTHKHLTKALQNKRKPKKTLNSINKKNKPTASSQYNQMPSASKPSTSSYTNKYNGYRGVDLKSSQKSIASNDRGSDYGGPVHPFTRPGSQFDSRSEFEFRGHTNKDKWTLKAFKEYMRNLR